MTLLDTIEKVATHVTTPESLRAKLAQGRPLRIKYGIDPTNVNMHLGHLVPLRLLRAFQDEGHVAVIVFGDTTAALGDPSGRDELRKSTTTLAEARKNSVLFRKQLARALNMENTEQHLNSCWLENMRTSDWANRLSQVTVQQLTERDDFRKRIAAGNPVHLSELLYPIMQGEDSVALRADVELGGSEQLFTLHMAREMQKRAGQEPQVCITLPILRGLDGERRMGKSLDNFVGVGEEPFEMFSKVMSIPDHLIPEWRTLLTSLQDNQLPPMEQKRELAHEITRWLHSETEATAAAERWRQQFSLRKAPEQIPAAHHDKITLPLFVLLANLELAPSRNTARKLVEQGAVQLDGIKVTDPLMEVEVFDGLVVKCGRQYARVSTN